MNERVSVHLAPVQPAKVGTIFANSYSTQACTLRFLYFGTGYAILVAVADGTKAYISRSVLRKAFGNIRIPDGTLVGGVLIPDDMGTCIQSIEWVEFTKDGLKRLRDQAQEMKRRSGFTTQEEVCSDA